MIFDKNIKNQKSCIDIAKQNCDDNESKNVFRNTMVQDSNTVDIIDQPKMENNDDYYENINDLSFDRTSDMQIPSVKKELAIEKKESTDDLLLSGIKSDVIGKLPPENEQQIKKQSLTEESQRTIKEYIKNNELFANRINTELYIHNKPFENTKYGDKKIFDKIPKKEEPLNEINQIEKNKYGLDSKKSDILINTSWLKEENPWQSTVESLKQINASGFNNVDNYFIKLLKAENTTAKLLNSTGLDKSLTSVATQIASIIESGTLQNIGLSNFVNEFGRFALSQHVGIQNAIFDGRNDDAKWRLGLLDAISKIVDRQVTQGNKINVSINDLAQRESNSINNEALWNEKQDNNYQIINNVQTAEISKQSKVLSAQIENIDEANIFTTIPQEIGYTRREKTSISQEEALEKSKIVKISELGFNIVNKILKINKLRDDLMQKSVFKPTDKSMWTMGMLGQFICDDENKFKKMINCMYSLIYENQNGIKDLLGNNDVDKGNELIRDDDYKCIFRIKDIRTDLNHDIEHGNEKDQKKKKEEINKAYQFYAKKKPSTAKEYKTFQILFYEDIIKLLDKFIIVINNSIDN